MDRPRQDTVRVSRNRLRKCPAEIRVPGEEQTSVLADVDDTRVVPVTDDGEGGEANTRGTNAPLFRCALRGSAEVAWSV